MTTLRVISGIFLLSFLVLYGISRTRINVPPDAGSLVGELTRDPVQTPCSEEPFTVERGGMTYMVKPLYEYELWGLVVSLHDTRAWWDYYHKRWGDALNVKDLCVLWSANAFEGLYRRMKFDSGSWTCYWRTNDGVTWQRFDQDRISNNHILAGESYVARSIAGARLWDQVRFRGYLCEYSHAEGFRRGTSTTRGDRGNGACETVYVKEFEILKQANAEWRETHLLAKWGSAIMAVVLAVACLVQAGRPGRKDDRPFRWAAAGRAP